MAGDQDFEEEYEYHMRNPVHWLGLLKVSFHGDSPDVECICSRVLLNSRQPARRRPQTNVNRNLRPKVDHISFPPPEIPDRTSAKDNGIANNINEITVDPTIDQSDENQLIPSDTEDNSFCCGLIKMVKSLKRRKNKKAVNESENSVPSSSRNEPKPETDIPEQESSVTVGIENDDLPDRDCRSPENGITHLGYAFEKPNKTSIATIHWEYDENRINKWNEPLTLQIPVKKPTAKGPIDWWYAEPEDYRRPDTKVETDPPIEQAEPVQKRRRNRRKSKKQTEANSEIALPVDEPLPSSSNSQKNCSSNSDILVSKPIPSNAKEKCPSNEVSQIPKPEPIPSKATKKSAANSDKTAPAPKAEPTVLKSEGNSKMNQKKVVPEPTSAASTSKSEEESSEKPIMIETKFVCEQSPYLESWRREPIPPEIRNDFEIRKYWNNRYRLFSKFDQGIRLDRESWYSVTPEIISEHISDRCRCDVIIDGFCGAGGNTIQFAFTCEKVIAIDIDPKKIELAKHNARIYGVHDRIEFIVGDFFKVIRFLKADVVFLSPPWGGPSYNQQSSFPLKGLCYPRGGKRILKAARKCTRDIAFYLPRNINTAELLSLSKRGFQFELEQNIMTNKLVAVTAYYGSLAMRK